MATSPVLYADRYLKGVKKSESDNFDASPSDTNIDFDEAYINKDARASLLSSRCQISLSWQDVNVRVKIPGKRSLCGKSEPATKKLILSNINGAVAPGSLVAIIGASGAGKSTLLNVLTNRNTKDYIATGKLLLNGVEVGSGIRNVSAYVQQDDLFITTLTVREHLQFRALLRMDKSLSRSARLERVEEVIGEMGLQSCAGNRIGASGGSKKGISGGERKRLSFASEALTGPPIFFCDEPTSGLDSFMAQTVVQTMQAMALKGTTVLCTIHQPSSEIYAMFSQIILLAEGRVAFMGDTHKCLDFFESQGYPCPRNYNPADHYILTLAIEPGKEETCREKCKAICSAFDAESIYTNRSDKPTRSATTEELALGNMVSHYAENSRYKPSYPAQLSQLFWRSWTCQFRDPILFGVRIGQALFVGLIMGLIYLNLKVDQSGVQNVNGALFLLLVNISFFNAFAVLSSFPDEVGIIMREFKTGLYRLDIYYFTKTVSEMPLFCMVTFLFCTVNYWLIGLNDTFEAYVIATAILIMAAIISASFGYTISIASGNTTVALSVAIPILVPFILFGGLFLNPGDIPPYFLWLDALSWFKYAYEILMVNQWYDMPSIECNYKNTTIGNLTIPARPCAYNTGKDVLLMYGMKKDDVDMDLQLLFVLFAGAYILAFIALYIRGKMSKE